MVISTFRLPESACPNCGESGRFVGLERHESLRNINVLTFECEQCGDYTTEQTVMKPAPSRLFRPAKSDH